MGKTIKTIAGNKKAYHDYFIEDKLECGMVLTGTEIKSIRGGRISIKEAYAKVDKGEVFIYGMNISPYEHGNRFNVEPMRPRKLLLHKKEINKLIGLTSQQGLTLVPISVYIDVNGRAKLTLGIARGKKNYDKRADIAKKEAARRMDRALKQR